MSEDPAMRAPPGPPARSDRLLSWIAFERALRALVLLAAGAVLVTHPHANWAEEVTRFAQRAGLDPKSNWVHRVIAKISKITTSENVLFGMIALAYGALEAVEAYGLARRRAWAEWLTVLATSLLFIPEVWELTKSTTALKLGALALNIAVVAYLLWRLRGRPQIGPLGRRESSTPSAP